MTVSTLVLSRLNADNDWLLANNDWLLANNGSLS
jgi:hypothetical protein